MSSNSHVHVPDESDIVTHFFLSTYRQQATEHDTVAAMLCGVTADYKKCGEIEVDRIPAMSGSSAELYVKTILPCIGDIDIMYHYGTELAIPAGYPAPTHLPVSEFHSQVEVCEIVDSLFPGYVYLVQSYLLTEHGKDGGYKAELTNTNRLHCLGLSEDSVRGQIRGPAQKCALGCVRYTVNNAMSMDAVMCVRCLSWPPQAADWSTRHRNYDWPDSAIVEHIVSNGCDLVQVAHRMCRQHEWERKNQWRLSFSRAEIVLLNSWLPVQQIVYHMLRIYVKSTQLTNIIDHNGTKILDNYHLKTLMLWAAELKPITWWTEDVNVVRINADLLRTLAVWLNNGHCRHYFINTANLVAVSFNSGRVVHHLGSLTESQLSAWFVNNYILKCAQMFRPADSTQSFDSAVSINTDELRRVVSVIVDWRRNSAAKDLAFTFFCAEHDIPSNINVFCETARSYHHWATELANVDSCLAVYFRSVAFLHVCRRIVKLGFSEKLTDMVTVMVGLTAVQQRGSRGLSGVLLLRQAVKFMKIASNKSCSTAQLIEFELSKAYLHRALRCKDSDDSIYCLAHVYLAVLYYTTRQHPTVIDHCTLVIRSQDHSNSKCATDVVHGELLPKIDDDVDNALGVVVFYQYVRTAALNRQQGGPGVNLVGPEMFAHYLLRKCLCGAERRQSLAAPSSRYIQDMKQPFIADVVLSKSVNNVPERKYVDTILTSRYGQGKMLNSNELCTVQLERLLQQYAVEQLTRFRQLQAQKLSSLTTYVTTDFEAMYAYQLGNYRRCLQLCTHNVHTLLTADSKHELPLYPDFIQLLDDDIVSLTAMPLLVNPRSRRIHSGNVTISQLTLSLYLMIQCQLKLRHSATQLAQTLDHVEVARRRTKNRMTLDHLTLQLTERKTMRYFTSQ